MTMMPLIVMNFTGEDNIRLTDLSDHLRKGDRLSIADPVGPDLLMKSHLSHQAKPEKEPHQRDDYPLFHRGINVFYRRLQSEARSASRSMKSRTSLPTMIPSPSIN